jgi:hypothetical protein
VPAGPNTRLTEIYADYLEEDAGAEPPLPENAGRVQQWAARTLPGAPTGPSRAVSQRDGTNAYARSQYGSSSGGSRRRGPSRPYPRSAAPSNFEGEEEGYGSGDYEEAFELLRIKVKASDIHSYVCRDLLTLLVDPLQWRSSWYGLYARRAL